MHQQVSSHQPRQLDVVRHDDERRLCALVQLGQKLVNLPRRSAVEVSRGLVGEDDLGFHHESSRDGHSLLLSARELTRLVEAAIGESYGLQKGQGELLSVLSA